LALPSPCQGDTQQHILADSTPKSRRSQVFPNNVTVNKLVKLV